MLATCAAEQANLPRLFDAFDRRLVSWSQVRWIVLALVRVPVALRRAIDAEVIGVHAEALADAEPHRLVELVDDQIMRRLPAYARKREKRQAEAEFVAFQPRIGGGVSLYGELGAVAAGELLCDATIVPMIRRDGRIIHVGDEGPRFSRKTRRVIEARDQGCRAPGCRMPAAQTDIHHIVPGYGDIADDGVLHCRQDHRRAHAHSWKIRLLDGGVLQYTINGKTYLSQPP